MQRRAPATEEGWYVLHDMRRIDWDAWRAAPERERDQATEEGVAFLERYEAVADAEAGQTAVYTVQGNECDLLIVHLRPTMADLDAAERAFEQTTFARFTERADSFVSVTEASGYTEKAREYFEGELDEDSGLAKYIRSRLHPEIPDDEFVSFYPMNKRRQPDQNWYDLPFEERAEHMERHGDIGRSYGGQVRQMITGAMGFDDWEWGVTLWADDMTDVKSLLSEMRFDRSTSKFAEFGPFYVGRRFPPADLPAVMAGERVPTGTEDAGESEHAHAEDADEGGHSPGHGEGPPSAGSDQSSDGTDSSTGGSSRGDPEFAEVDDAGQRLGSLGLGAGEDYDEGDYGLVFYSDADARELADEVDGLRSNFDHYDRHVQTGVRAEGGRAAVVSVWTAKEAAETAAGFLGDLAGVQERYGGRLGDAGDAGEGTDGNAGDDGESGDGGAASIRDRLDELDVYAGQPHGEDVYALALYSDADPVELAAEVEGLRERFDRDDDHVKTAVYSDATDETTAVVSLWESQDAADGASDSLADLPGVVGRADPDDGFGTMGMFYTVEPEHREDFVETFEEVGAILADMEGHRETTLLINRENENDMFIASEWDAREDAMAFFRSEDFAETVEWGRDVLADRPRHVFLA